MTPRDTAPSGVSIVVCCHNSIARLSPTLAHLAGQQVPAGLPWEVIVVDNASTDGTGAFARAHWPANAPVPLRVVDEPRPGLSAARACGFTNARYGVVAFVDDDNWVCPSWVVEAERVFREHPEVGLCGGDNEAEFEVSPPRWFEYFAGYFAVGRQGETSSDITETRGVVWGAGMCVRAAAWAELKSRGFQFWLSDRVGNSLASGGDCELCFGLRLIGWRIWYEPRLRLKHYLPAKRVDWNYLLRLAWAAGATDTLLAPYHAVLDARQRGATPRRPGWATGVCRQLSLLARHPLKLLLPRFVPPADIVRFNQYLYLGHLSALFQHRKLLREQWAGLVAAIGNHGLQH